MFQLEIYLQVIVDELESKILFSLLSSSSPLLNTVLVLITEKRFFSFSIKISKNIRAYYIHMF